MSKSAERLCLHLRVLALLGLLFLAACGNADSGGTLFPTRTPTPILSGPVIDGFGHGFPLPTATPNLDASDNFVPVSTNETVRVTCDNEDVVTGELKTWSTIATQEEIDAVGDIYSGICGFPEELLANNGDNLVQRAIVSDSDERLAGDPTATPNAD